MSKKTSEKYRPLNESLAKKHGISPKAVGHIRSSVLGGKQTKEQIIEHCNARITESEKAIQHHTENARRFADTKNFLETCTDEQFADLTNKDAKVEG